MSHRNLTLGQRESEYQRDPFHLPVAAGAAARVGATPDSLPRVVDLELRQFGVRPAHVDVEYLSRSREAGLAAHLAARRPVLVVGDSMAGKSRMAAEVLRREYPDWPIVVGIASRELAELAAGDGLPRRCVVWLGDLDQYLKDSAPVAEAIDRLRQRDCLVVATMRAVAQHGYRPGEGPRPVGFDLLERFEVIRVEFDDDEQQRLAATVGDPGLRKGILRYGLAEYVGSGYRAVQRYVAGLREHPLGAAMVRVAADWRRAGLEVVPDAVLIELAGAYLPARRPNAESADAALSWACACTDDVMGLLERVDGGRRAFDYLVDHLTKHGTPIPDATWAAVRENCSAADAVRVGYIAYTLGRRDVAVTLWQRAAEAGHPNAATTLKLLRRAGNTESPATTGNELEISWLRGFVAKCIGTSNAIAGTAVAS